MKLLRKFVKLFVLLNLDVYFKIMFNLLYDVFMVYEKNLFNYYILFGVCFYIFVIFIF